MDEDWDTYMRANQDDALRCFSCGHRIEDHVDDKSDKCLFGPGRYTKDPKPYPRWTIKLGPK